MELECPKCFKNTQLEVQAGVVCSHCTEDISEFKYKKPIVSTTTAFILGVGGFFAVDSYVLSEDRYPIDVEYAIIDSCVRSSKKLMRSGKFSQMQSICVCALEETMKDISYSDLSDKEAEFIGFFERKANECR